MTKRIKTDILVVGGGLSGCMAAINASDHGAKVAIVEKSHTERSGAAGTGNDHFWRALDTDTSRPKTPTCSSSETKRRNLETASAHLRNLVRK